MYLNFKIYNIYANFFLNKKCDSYSLLKFNLIFLLLDIIISIILN